MKQIKPINFTPEDIRALQEKAHKVANDLVNNSEGNFDHADIEAIWSDYDLNAAAEAQKKLLEWWFEPCTEHKYYCRAKSPNRYSYKHRYECPQCREYIKQHFGIGE